MSQVPFLDLSSLQDAVAGGALALRRTQRLQPAGGRGDKIFPPTYEGGQYAIEERVIDGVRVPCALLDSVQSQANRMELALRDAFYRGPADASGIPIVVVDFGANGLPEVGEITSLDAPHRLADAILRDSLLDGKRFRDSGVGRVLDSASASNATGLYQFCPTALVFGLWDSTGPRGGLGTKFQRALVSEIVAVDVQAGVRPSSRLDPLGIALNAGPIYRAREGEEHANDWTLDESQALREKDRPVLIGKDGKPSEINHGNVTPSLQSEKGQPHHGGVTMDHARQTVVLSVPALRRLRFPSAEGVLDNSRDLLARTALAALGLAAAQLSIDGGCDLRSRCLLIPDAENPADWELIGTDGRARSFRIPDPVALVSEAAAAAAAGGLPPWSQAPIVLTPRPDLVQLVRKSRELKSAEPAQG